MSCKRVGIIGGGQAGIKAAQKLADADVDVTVYSDENVLPYYRPRVVALAFSLVNEESLPIHPAEWYEEHNINLKLGEKVTALRSPNKEVVSGSGNADFDSIIIAAGAKPFIPPFARNKQKVIPMWDYERSHMLRSELSSVQHLVIVGGGITGVETAIYAREQGIETTLIECLDRVMPLQLGETAGQTLKSILQEKGVDVKTEAFVEDVEEGGNGLCVRMREDDNIVCDLVITAVGGRPDLAPYIESGLRVDKGVQVDTTLQTSVHGVFGAGDIAQQDGCTAANLRLAAQHGSGAAENVLQYLNGEDLIRHEQEPIALSFKHGDFQIHTAGSCPSETEEEERVLEKSDGIFRALRLEKGILKGVEMIGSRKEFRKFCDAIGNQVPSSK